jgi:peptidase E
MKLILGSDYSFLERYGYALTGIPKEDMRIGYITTAGTKAHDPSFLEQRESSLRRNGYIFESIDLTRKSTSEIRRFFAEKNLIQVEGGNTFYLLKIIRETGFDILLDEFLCAGKVVREFFLGVFTNSQTLR